MIAQAWENGHIREDPFDLVDRSPGVFQVWLPPLPPDIVCREIPGQHNVINVLEKFLHGYFIGHPIDQERSSSLPLFIEFILFGCIHLKITYYLGCVFLYLFIFASYRVCVSDVLQHVGESP